MTTPRTDAALLADEDEPPDPLLARFVGPFLEAGLRLDVGVGRAPGGRWHLWATRLGLDLTGPLPGVLHVFRAKLEAALTRRGAARADDDAIVRLVAVVRRYEGEASPPGVRERPRWERPAEEATPAAQS